MGNWLVQVIRRLILRLFQIPARKDNYIYCAADSENRAFVVDPADARPVEAFLSRHPEIRLEAILNTHHHHDHVGGNEALQARHNLKIYGPAHDAERIPGLTHPVDVETEFSVGQITLRVHDVKAHTRGHICFQTLSSFSEVYRHGHAGEVTLVNRLGGHPALFVGDSLFLGGCGRLFEGTPEQLHRVMTFYRSLSGGHLVVCAHEYTEGNLKFAQTVFPGNASIEERLASFATESGGARSSVPDLLEKEFATNPFLMVFDEENRKILRTRYGELGPVGLIQEIRRAKDQY